MGRRIDVDDMIDAADVAKILGLANQKSVHVYAARYADMPKPVLDRGPRRAKLWLRSEVLAWQRRRSSEGS
jgi:predicted DNA-binding transcriptional regulator AlpA